MTPEEIKKIAEEYAEAMCPVGDYCGGVYDEQRNCDLPIYHDDAKTVLEWLSERYYLVEKGKVEEEYEGAKWHKEIAEGMNVQYGKGMASGQIMVLENLFGPDIRKEEEK